MRRLLNFIKIAALIIAVFISYSFINDIFITSNDQWEELYSYDKNTIDILHLGSSHSYRTFITPLESQMLEVDVYGMSMPGVKIEQIEYTLEECLKYQSPKIVVLEMFTISDYSLDDFNTLYVHRTFDTMRFSETKVDGINYNVTDDTKLEYYFPMTTYHLKWKDENIGKYISRVIKGEEVDKTYLGYYAATGVHYQIPGDRYYVEENVEQPDCVLDEERYKSLDRIVELCNENDVQLIFAVAPYKNQLKLGSQELSILVDSLKEYTQQHGIDVINYNYLLDEINYDNTDLNDNGHLNMDGGFKVTEYLIEYLDDNYSELLNQCTLDYADDTQENLEDILDTYLSFSQKKESILNDYQFDLISYKNNMAEYLNMLNDDRYITIISTKNSNYKYVDEQIRNSMHELGLDFKVEKNSSSDQNYVAIINGSNSVVEVLSDKKITLDMDSEELQAINLPFYLEVISAGETTGNNSVIKIDNKDYSFNRMGINIVVYDTYLGEMVNKANFNLNSNEQHYFDRYHSYEKYDENKVVYSTDLSTVAGNIQGASASYDEAEGVLVKSTGDNPRFILTDYSLESSNILLRAEIECSEATVFELEFNGMSEKVQLVTGYNDIYIEVDIDKNVSGIKIHPADSPGDYLVKNIEICDLS